MARTEGKRSQPKPKAKPAAQPAPPAAVLPTAGQEQPSGIGKKVIIAAAALVGLAAVVVLGITLASEETNNPGGGGFPFPDVGVSGGALPSFDGNPEGDPALGMTIPEVSSLDMDGNPASIENDGAPKMILFLAHWCVHCQREVPVLQSWINENGVPAGVDLVSVATSISEIRPNYPPDAWLRREGWTPRVVVDDEAGRISSAFGLTSFPYYVLVDGSGNVVRRLAGGQPPDLVGALLGGLAAGG